MLEVSLDTIDNGRGMNSSVSEKPTRARVTGLATGDARPLELADPSDGVCISLGTFSEGSDSTYFNVFSSCPVGWFSKRLLS